MDFNSIRKRLIATVTFLLFYSQVALAACGTTSVSAELTEINSGLMVVAAALGTLMIAIMGVKWIMSENPQEREDAKKGVIYVIIGLLLVTMATTLVDEIYCAHLVY